MNKVYSYKTIASTSEGMYKEKGSKFIGYAYPISSVNQVKALIEELKKEHNSARHFCYAYRIGVGQKEQYRYNDDGEPNNSAGKPIYGQILSNELTNVLVVVVRYFGGTKLGVGGLISAYRVGAKEALEANKIIEKEITKPLTILFGYNNMSEVMSIINKNELVIINQKLEIDCEIKCGVLLSQYESVLNQFQLVHGIKLKKG